MNNPKLNCLLTTVLVAGGLLSAQPASAQLPLPGGGTFTPFAAPGFSDERKVDLKANEGPFNTIYGEFVLPPAGALDWHTNPGVAIITVTEGVVNEFHSNGCVSLHEAGDVFFEVEGEVHKIVNGSNTAQVKALIAFLFPVGRDLVTFAPPPAEMNCPPGQEQ